ncbi:hypothetical protein [Archangium sp.]|uniref:hypothetical protein n=1 Tax=Archangium sp. TaxID=1872627 RepID=UPI002D2F2CD9|nr:hypothetical protein [Archangium sp.]HYO58846.1 hypothetical protein [Archangium sp.]
MYARKPVIVLLGLAVCGGLGCAQPPACREGQVATPVSAQRHPVAGHHLRAHAHNDYEHERPLFDALDHRFYSVEADIFLNGGKLAVSHRNLPWDSKRSLEELYLEPLQARVDATGSVHGDGVPFTLWIDLKEGGREIVDTLHAVLEKYPMLTRVDGDEVLPGPVTVVLTGDDKAKRDLVTRHSQRRAVRDSNDYSPEDPPADSAWGYYALRWGDYLDASSTGQLDASQRARLACIIENAHAQGRKVRFFDAPDHPDAWRVALEFGVDFLGTDDLRSLDTFLDGAP